MTYANTPFEENLEVDTINDNDNNIEARIFSFKGSSPSS
jgi:hypothetical protein